jgi:hypothetical protein
MSSTTRNNDDSCTGIAMTFVAVLGAVAIIGATIGGAAASGGAVIGGTKAGMSSDTTAEAVVNGAWNGFAAGATGAGTYVGLASMTGVGAGPALAAGGVVAA